MENFQLKVLLSYVLFMTSLFGCGQFSFEPGSNNILGGKILPLEGIVLQRAPSSSFIQSAYAAPTCSGSVYARLHKLENDGTLNPSPLLSAEVFQGKYEFRSGLPADIKETFVNYQVVIDGCDEILYRPVTGLNNNQDVTYTSTLVGHAAQTNLTNPLSSTSRIEVEKLINNIGGTSILQAYNNLNSSPSLTNTFNNIFSDPPLQLALSHPSVSVLSFPTLINEGLSSTFKVSALHFDPGYPVAYEWHLDGTEVGILNQWVYSPDADSAGDYVVTVFVGRNDGSSRVDRTKPYYTLSKTVTVLNTIPATPAPFTLASAYSNTSSVTLSVNTGVSLDNCESFEYFLLTESTSAPSPSNAGFNRSCTTLGTQNETYTIVGGEGVYTLSLWVKDSNGLVSASPTTQTITFDSTNPSAAITSPSGSYRGGSSLGLSFTASDGGSGLQSVKLQYSSDGLTFSDITSVAVTATNYNWTVPTDNTTTAYVRIEAIDAAGNVTTVTSSSFTIDSTPPAAPGASLASAATTNSTSAGITLSSCADISGVLVSDSATAPSPASGNWQTCSTASGAVTHTVPTGDGVKSMYVWSKDSVGNVSPSTSLSLTLDQTNPTVALTSFTGGEQLAGSTSQNITWTASDVNMPANPITIEASFNGGSSWSNIAASESNDGTYVWTVPAIDNTSVRIRIRAVDAAGNTSVSASSTNFTIDGTAPAVGALLLGSGSSTATNNNVTVDLSASDSTTKVTHFCLKYNNTTTPLSADTCWVPFNNPSPNVTPALNVSFSGYYFLLGFAPGTYNVYGWVKDQVGNISSLSNSGAGTNGVDQDDINYQPGTPSVITDVMATGVDNPSSPPTNTDLSAPSGSDIFIKWNASDDQTLPSTPVSLYYTTDDVNFTLLASNISNAQGAGCTLTASHTGCYKWTGGSPTNGYLKIRVAVKDSNSMVTYASSTSLNVMPPIRFLAGNTDPGLGASATSAMFFNYKATADLSDAQSMAVAKNGTIYFRDVNRGLLMIDPATGVQSLLIPYDSTVSAGFGDGGNVNSAKLKRPTRILLDYNDDLLIWDYDRIRKITTSTSPMTIQTIIGGGVSTADGVTPLSVALTAFTSISDVNASLFILPLPNGDIYFRGDTLSSTIGSGTRIRHYRAANNDVVSITFSGTGCSTSASQDLSNFTMSYFGAIVNPTTSQIVLLTARMRENVSSNAKLCTTAFDPATGVAETNPPPYGRGEHLSGRDGKMYRYDRHLARLYQYNSGTQSWVTLLGNGIKGSCPDGTLATSCPLDLHTAEVSSSGQIYFADRGKIRTIDSTGNVVSLYGQNFSFGDGGHPLSARFDLINSIDQSNDGKIVILDQQEARFREFTIDATITTIAGNGGNAAPDTINPAVNQPVLLTSAGPYWDDFRLDPITGDIFYNRSNYSLAKLNRSTGKWVDLVGMGATFYTSADGSTGTNIDLGNYPVRVLGINGTDVLTAIQHYINPSLSDSFLKQYSFSDGTYTQTHLAGVTGTSVSDYCIDGTSSASCNIPNSYTTHHTRAAYDTTGTRWLLMKLGTKAVRTLSSGGTMGTLVTLTNNVNSFTYRRTGTTPAEVIYYCDTNGRLRKHDLTTDSALAWPITSMRCTGRSLIYNSSRNSLIFPYTQNGLYGVAEYLDP